MRFRIFLVGLLLVASLAALPAVQAQVWEVGNKRLAPSSPQAGEQFGWAVAIGDFNGDGVDDLVVGAPRWESVYTVNAGAWTVYWGSTNRTLISAGTWRTGGTSSTLTGWALASGDFDNDGRDEIAIGQPAFDAGGVGNSGNVMVMDYASGNWSLVAYLSQVYTTPSTSPEANDNFGTRLTVGNFNGDSYQDLVVGSHHEDDYAGVVQIFYGGPSGLRTDNPQTVFSPNSSAGEQFGYALAAGDFDDDGYSDLAVGAPMRQVASQESAGAVEIYRGSPGGLTTPPQVIDDGDFPGGSVGEFENFGLHLAAGQFDQSQLLCNLFHTPCYDDLAISVTGQFDIVTAAGNVLLAYGSASGPDPAAGDRLRPSDVGISAVALDTFGTGLAAGRLDRDLYRLADLAIGTIGRSCLSTNDGMVTLAFGHTAGVNSGHAPQSFCQSTGFAISPAVDRDFFGRPLAIGDLDGDGWGDLVVGVPFKGADDMGAVQVLYGALFADGFGTNGLSQWSP